MAAGAAESQSLYGYGVGGRGREASDGQQAHPDADEKICRGDERQGTGKAVGQVGMGVHDGTLFR